MIMKAIIVEDELPGQQNLIAKLKLSCPHVEVVGTARTVEDGVREIRTKQPDLVFLDIHLGPANGFEILDRLPHLSFHVIITTDHSTYGIKAVKAGAVDYLVKPFDIDELALAVDKVAQATHAQPDTPKQSNRIAIPVSDGYKLVSVDEILYVRSNNQRTIFQLYSGKTIDSPRLLKEVFKKLEGFGFERIHRSHIVNMEYVDSFSRTDGGYVTMSDGERLDVSQQFPLPKI